jgi:hypothetical protein
MAKLTGKIRLGEGVKGKPGPKRMSGTEVPVSQAKITTSKSEPKPGLAKKGG